MFKNNKDILYFVAKKNGSVWEKMLEHIKQKCSIDDEEFENACKELETIESKGWKFTSLISHDYSERFKRKISKPPFIIFSKGNYEILNELETRIIGYHIKSVLTKEERKNIDNVILENTKIKRDHAHSFLLETKIVDNQLKVNIDYSLLEKLINKNEKIIITLPKSFFNLNDEESRIIDLISNYNNGLVITFIEPYSIFSKENYDYSTFTFFRMLDYVVFPTCKKEDGLLVYLALECGAELFFFPKNIDQSEKDDKDLSNFFIKQGANIVSNYDDVRMSIDDF